MKRAIPTVSQPNNPGQAKFNQAVKEDLELLMGLRDGKIESLASTATTAQIIDKINELIGRLQ